jgi:hypothetical protein
MRHEYMRHEYFSYNKVCIRSGLFDRTVWTHGAGWKIAPVMLVKDCVKEVDLKEKG